MAQPSRHPVQSSPPGGGSPLGRWVSFLAAAWRSPREVGTIFPSGPALASRLACVLPRTGAPVILELGAGTGEVTRVLAETTGPDATVIAIERDPVLADRLRARGLGVEVVTADAADVPAILAERGIGRADAIVSVLPWAMLPAAAQRHLIAALAGALRPEGVFTAAAYSSGYWTASGRRFRAELQRCFQEVVTTRTMWRHLPPALTYIARQPRQGAKA